METITLDANGVLTGTYKELNKILKITNIIMLQNIGNKDIYVSDGVMFSSNNEGWLIQPGETFKSNTGVVYVRPSINEIKITVQGTING